MRTDGKCGVSELRDWLEALRDYGYQPMYNGRPSCPRCLNFIDEEETHRPGCLLLHIDDALTAAAVSA